MQITDSVLKMLEETVQTISLTTVAAQLPASYQRHAQRFTNESALPFEIQI